MKMYVPQDKKRWFKLFETTKCNVHMSLVTDEIIVNRKDRNGFVVEFIIPLEANWMTVSKAGNFYLKKPAMRKLKKIIENYEFKVYVKRED